MPEDTIVKRIRVYRAVSGQKASMLKEMSSIEKQFEDATVELDTTYFYFITTVSAKNKASKPTNAVSAKVRG